MNLRFESLMYVYIYNKHMHKTCKLLIKEISEIDKHYGFKHASQTSTSKLNTTLRFC